MPQTPKNEGGFGSEPKVPAPRDDDFTRTEQSGDNLLRGAEEQMDQSNLRQRSYLNE